VTLIARIPWIVGLADDPVRRNLLITDCYHELSTALGQAVGAENANWCTFATWASKTAGRFVRNDEIPAAFRGELAGAPPVGIRLRHVNEALVRARADAASGEDGLLGLSRTISGDVARLIAAGNLAVFGELAPIFARAAPILAAGGDLQPLLDGLRPGSTSDGQALLHSALSGYAAARAEPDPHRKAELMLLANGQIGLHEQRRLQPFIAGSIDVPVDDALQGSLDELLESLPGLLRRPLEATLARLAHPLAAEVQTVWQELCTRELMTLTLPDGTLLLGRDLPARPGEPPYPAALTQFDDVDLASMLEAYGADRPGYVGSAAVDWTVLTERMRYILDLFRARQVDGALLEPPFTAAQSAAMLAGDPVTGPL
jgi:hypothetical protein